MTPIDDADVLAAFNRRLAAIEPDVKDGSTGMPRRAILARPTAWRPRATGRGVIVPLLVAIALVVAVALIRPIAVAPRPAAGPVGSQPTTAASPTPSADIGQGPARLRIQAIEQYFVQSEPSGIAAPGGLRPLLLFRVSVTSRSNGGTITIPADTSWRELDLAPGSFDVYVSERWEVTDVDNGRNIVEGTSGPCALHVDLAPGTTTMLTVTDVLGDACTFNQRLMVPPPPSSPSPGLGSVSPGPSKLPKSPTSKARAMDLATEEAPAGAPLESITMGLFPFDLLPPWATLDQLIPPAHLVWAAHFAPATAGCPGRDTCGQTVVYLDYLSGAFLVSVRAPATP